MFFTFYCGLSENCIKWYKIFGINSFFFFFKFATCGMNCYMPITSKALDSKDPKYPTNHNWEFSQFWFEYDSIQELLNWLKPIKLNVIRLDCSNIFYSLLSFLRNKYPFEDTTLFWLSPVFGFGVAIGSVWIYHILLQI